MVLTCTLLIFRLGVSHRASTGHCWRLVRRVSPGYSGVVHPASDNLSGVDEYAIPDVGGDSDCVSPLGQCTFSRTWDRDVEDEFLFATGDMTSWAYFAATAEMSSEDGDVQQLCLLGSNDGCAAVQRTPWMPSIRSAAELGGPVIGIGDTSNCGASSAACDKVLYREDAAAIAASGVTPQSDLSAQHGGLNVFVRAAGHGVLSGGEGQPCLDDGVSGMTISCGDVDGALCATYAHCGQILPSQIVMGMGSATFALSSTRSRTARMSPAVSSS